MTLTSCYDIEFETSSNWYDDDDNNNAQSVLLADDTFIVNKSIMKS